MSITEPLCHPSYEVLPLQGQEIYKCSDPNLTFTLKDAAATSTMIGAMWDILHDLGARMCYHANAQLVCDISSAVQCSNIQRIFSAH